MKLMTGRISGNCKRLIFSLLILLGFSGAVLSFQTNVHAVINKYGRVTGIGPYPTTGYVYVNDPVQLAQFHAGDTVLLIQMKGAQATVPETPTFGTLQSSVGSPGKYEFLIVQSIDGGLKKIIFRNNIVNSYDVTGDIQIIKTPSYNSVVVDADLTCAPWDSLNKTGGVLAMIVGKSIVLNANIDVTGKGFLGGGTVTGDGICANSNLSLYDKYSYKLASDSSGLKGESPVSKGWIDFLTQIPIFPSFSKGKGANFTGGGGGNGNSSGGGGGANYGAGGKGGFENNACFPTAPVPGGIGGKQIKFTLLAGGVFPGSGGGSSTYYSGSTPSQGGNGGGIILILCDTIIGNGKIIRADGAGASGASGNAGSGGGGGGGSIALYMAGFSTSNITISAKGGKGGDNAGQFGEGGGGGGGLIWINNITINPVYITRTVAAGAVGTRPGGSTGTNGAAGESLTNFVAVLNGFLFNSIRSSVTGDQLDSICSNMMPKLITGTNPVGGSGSYTIKWQKSYNPANLADTTDILLNTVNYQPTVIETADSVFFRRIVKDNGTSLRDVSKWVKIIVHPFIKNNIIGNPDTICYNLDPPLIHQLLPNVTDGNKKSYYFNWQDSTSAGTWGSTVATSRDYDPPAGLTRSSWYRRTVTSGRCIDSTAKVKITVLDTISNNKILTTPAPICYGMIFPDLSATVSPALAGGDNSYIFKWESSGNGTTWTTASGVSNGTNYNPDELASYFPGSRYFRRVVYSGIHDVCVNNSSPKLLTDWPVISSNTISANQTIGHDSVPATLIGVSPVNGSGSYTYLWQYKTKIVPWSAATGSNNLINYSPPALTDTTWYRRVVNSSACSDTSNIIVIKVHKTIITNSITFVSAAVEDTICNGSIPAILKGTLPAGGSNIPGDYSFQWYYSLNNTTWNTVLSAGTAKDYQPGSLSVTTWFRRNVSSPVVSPTSISRSNTIKITVLPLITNKDISADQIVCKGNPIAAISGLSGSPAGGDNTYRYTWRQDSANTGWKNIPGYIKSSSAGSYSRSSIKDPFKYKRYVYSGSDDCCADSSNYVSIGIYPLPVGSITTVTDTTVCGGSQVPVKIHLTGAPNWKLIYAENGVQATINKIQAADTTLLINRTPTGAFSSYLFKLDSLKDANKCVALPVTLTGSRKINVYKIPKSEAGTDAAVCGPKYTLAAGRADGITLQVL